jgi:nitrate reductase gamma subunit
MIKIRTEDWFILFVLAAAAIAGLWNIIFPESWWNHYKKAERKKYFMPDLGTGKIAMLHDIAYGSPHRRKWNSITWGVFMLVIVAIVLIAGFSEGGRWHN